MEPCENWPKWNDYNEKGYFSEQAQHWYSPGTLRLITERFFVKIRDQDPAVSIWEVKKCVEAGNLSVAKVQEKLKTK